MGDNPLSLPSRLEPDTIGRHLGDRNSGSFAGPSARFNDGRFWVTTERSPEHCARFVFTGHWPLQAWGVGTTSVRRRGPPSLPGRAEYPWPEQMDRKMLRFVEKRGVQASRNGPSEDSKCWQRIELGIHGLRSWSRNW